MEECFNIWIWISEYIKCLSNIYVYLLTLYLNSVSSWILLIFWTLLWVIVSMLEYVANKIFLYLGVGSSIWRNVSIFEYQRCWNLCFFIFYSFFICFIFNLYFLVNYWFKISFFLSFSLNFCWKYEMTKILFHVLWKILENGVPGEPTICLKPRIISWRMLWRGVERRWKRLQRKRELIGPESRKREITLLWSV